MIYATWCVSNNVGDALTHWLIEKITGKPPVFVERGSYHVHHIAAGSILNWATKDSVVWGAGFASKNDTVAVPMGVAAVRGPRSAAILKRCTNIEVDVFGDPALVLPSYYDNRVKRTHEVGIIPHYADQEAVRDSYLGIREGIKIIDVFSSVEKFVDEIRSCKCIFSSSLHGLIIAHAYGIPAKWFEAGHRLGGDGMKFADHLESVGLVAYAPMKLYDLQYQLPDVLVAAAGECGAMNIRKKLLNACPFK